MDKILLNKFVESKNFTAIAEKLGQLHPADIAEFLKNLDSVPFKRRIHYSVILQGLGNGLNNDVGIRDFKRLLQF